MIRFVTSGMACLCVVLGVLVMVRPVTSRTAFAAVESPAVFQWNKPDWAPTPIVPSDNPMTAAKVQLGRRLFYDERLSRDGSLSCANCHQQARAFTDGKPVHLGVNGELGIRNAMTLTNVAYLPTYTWTNPLLTSLEQQMQVPLFGDHPIEMGMAGHETQLIAALSTDPKYPCQFAQAFPEDGNPITLPHMLKAIGAFERTLLSFDSTYDHYKHGDSNAISAAAKRGEALFFGERLECYHCHGGINFTDNHIQQGQAIAERGFHNTGLYNEDGLGAYKSWDHGLRGVTGNEDDEGAFRTPTLRNVAVTAPYMHDGSVATLRDVILHHYAVKGHAALGPSGANPLRSEFIEGFKLSETETRDLIAFLESLTDETFLHNPEFSDPSANSANATVPAHTKERGVHGKSK